MNNICFKTYESIPVNYREVCRYMSCKNPDEKTKKLLEQCVEESDGVLSYKVCYSVFDIAVQGDKIDFGFVKTTSHSLAINLKNCKKAVVFAATVGHGFDRLIKKENLLSPAKALCFQALGSERVESLCDTFNEEIKAELEKGGMKLKPRFSPGYGDLSLEIQRSIIPVLNCTKLLGISLGENLMMSPSKSVTAIVGIW